jgi:hypothetical protein
VNVNGWGQRECVEDCISPLMAVRVKDLIYVIDLSESGTRGVPDSHVGNAPGPDGENGQN